METLVIIADGIPIILDVEEKKKHFNPLIHDDRFTFGTYGTCTNSSPPPPLTMKVLKEAMDKMIGRSELYGKIMSSYNFNPFFWQGRR